MPLRIPGGPMSGGGGTTTVIADKPFNFILDKDGPIEFDKTGMVDIFLFKESSTRQVIQIGEQPGSSNVVSNKEVPAGESATAHVDYEFQPGSVLYVSGVTGPIRIIALKRSIQ